VHHIRTGFAESLGNGMADTAAVGHAENGDSLVLKSQEIHVRYHNGKHRWLNLLGMLSSRQKSVRLLDNRRLRGFL
jgi:hypothetical protein